MRLLSARVRDYRLHRDLPVDFDPRFTVIAGPNQSGKSTLAEALHRALFLPVKTGGELLKGMQSDPFLAEPEVELQFETAGQRWELRKRFAGNRGSVSLRDSAGRSLQGDEAEARLAELIGTSAVPRNRGAADQLKERWGHLWVWQGSASNNPLTLSTTAYDHDRLVERLQAGADLGVQSPLDLAVLEDIQARWSTIYTAGGANRAPQVRKGSPLQLARAATAQAQVDLEMIGDQIAQQADAEQAYQDADAQLEIVRRQLPAVQAQRRELEQQLARSKELEAEIAIQEPQLQTIQKQRDALRGDHKQLTELQQELISLEGAKAPDLQALDGLQQQLPDIQAARTQAQEQLDAQEQGVLAANAEVAKLEQRQKSLNLLQEQRRLHVQLTALTINQERFAALQADLAQLPELTAADVEALRRLEMAVRDARVRSEALSAGIEVIRTARPVRVGGVELAAGARRSLTEPTIVQVGDDVELRFTQGDGSSAVEAVAVLASAQKRFQEALQRWTLQSVDEAATSERRRSDLLAEQQRLIEQRGGADSDALRRRLKQVTAEIGAAAELEPTDLELGADALEQRLQSLEQQISEARHRRDAATAAEREQRTRLGTYTTALEKHTKAISTAQAALRERENRSLAVMTRIEALKERHGSDALLTAALDQVEHQAKELSERFTGLQEELTKLGADVLRTRDRELARQITSLVDQERQASEARIRAESRLHADGQMDLQAELEQKQADLESRLADQERLEKEAGMLTLLRRLLEEEQNAMATQYTTPLTERIGRYLAQVFPEAPQPSLNYDARGGFQGLEWRRGDEAAFGFDVLSTGAREQFAAALRVTMAEVLAEAYDGTLPVLFDDAFANSDPERQAGVYRMLQKAADQGLQVILLTCDPERSQAIDGASRISLVS